MGVRKDQSRKEDKQRLRVLHIVTMNRKETTRDTVLEGRRHFPLRMRTTGEKTYTVIYYNDFMTNIKQKARLAL